MPTEIRALIVILLVSACVFLFAKRPTASLIASDDFERRRNVWLAVTSIVFLAHNFWLYIVLAGMVLLLAIKKESNKVGFYFFLLFAVPAIQEAIPGLGIINHFFYIDYLRLLSLAILLPAGLELYRNTETVRFGKTTPDKLLALFVVHTLFLAFLAGTLTNTMRTVFLLFIDIVLPYFVVSRSLKNVADFRDALMSFVLAAMLMAALAAVEAAKGWLLYASLSDTLGVIWSTVPLERGDSLRAQVTTGQPIPLGYAMAVALGFYFYLQRFVPNLVQRALGMALLLIGLIAPLSRGPWVGAAVIVMVFIAIGPKPAIQLLKVGLIVAVIGGLTMATPMGEKLIDLLPFVGSEDGETVTYRQQLLEFFVPIVLDNPIFGASDYLYSPAVEGLRQGQGIIDLVNTYLIVALYGGMPGLGLFSAFFIIIGLGIYSTMRRIADKKDERYLLGQALLASLIGILFIIFTVSNISIIPYVYWCVAGLGQAYWLMVLQSSQSGAFIPSGAGLPTPTPSTVDAQAREVPGRMAGMPGS